MLGMHIADWCVAVCVLAGIVSVGWCAGRRNQTAEEFFVGGRRFGWARLTLFGLASRTSGDQVANITGLIFRGGLGAIWFQFLRLPGVPFYWFIAPYLRRARVHTTADLFELRFGATCARLYALFGVLMSVFLLAGGLMCGASMVQQLTGSPHAYHVALPILTASFLLFAVVGGADAIIVAGAVQGVLTLLMTFVVVVAVWMRFDGMAGLVHAVDALGVQRLLEMDYSRELATALSKPSLTPFYIVMATVLGVVGVVASPELMPMCAAARTETDARIALTLTQWLKRLFSVGWAIIALGGMALLLDSETVRTVMSDRTLSVSVFARVAMETLPAGVIGIVMAGACSAVMSIAALHALVGASLFAKNLATPLLNKDATDQRMLRITRWTMVCMTFAAGGVAVVMPGVLRLIEILISAPVGIGVAFWFGLFWRRFNAAGMIAASVVGWATWVFLEWQGGARLVASVAPTIVTELAGKREVNDAWLMLLMLTASIVAAIVATLLTRPPTDERMRRFDERMRSREDRPWQMHALAFAGFALASC